MTGSSRFYRVALEQIGYLRAVLEGYDGLAVLHAADSNRGEVELLVAEGREAEAAEVLARLTVEAGLIEIERPAGWRSID